MIKFFSIYAFARIINGLCSIAMLYVLTTALSAEQYGAYSLFFTFSVSIGVVAYQWIGTSIFRFNNPDSALRSALYSEAIRLFCLVSLIQAVVSPLIFCFALPDIISWKVVLIMVFLTSFVGMVDLQLNFASSSGLPTQYAILSSGKSVATIVILCGLLLLDISVLRSLFAITLGYFFATIYGLVRNRNNFTKRSVELRRQIISYGLPMSISTVAIVVIDFSDRFMLGVFAELSSVGEYSAAYNLSQQTTGACLSIALISLFPRVSRAYERSETRLVWKYSALLLLTLAAMAFPIISGFVWFSHEVSTLFLGGSVASSAAGLMPIISLAIFVGILKSSAFDIPSKLEKETAFLLSVSISMAVLNVALNYFLIQSFGSLGAALSTLITFLFGLFISFFKHFRFWRLRVLLGQFGKILLSGFLFHAALYSVVVILSFNWIIGANVAIFTYVISLYLLNPFRSIMNDSY